MPAVIPIILIASAAIAAYSAVQQGKAAKAAADYNSQIQTQNAEIVREDAKVEADQSRRETLMRLGSIRAAQGASGGAGGEGSVLDVLGMVASEGKRQEQNIIYRGEQAARGYSNTAQLDTFSGSQAQKAGYLKAGSELMGGASSAYGSMQRT
jgi:hypothetical protein